MEDKNMSEVKKATRDGFGEEIVKLGKLDNDIYVVDIDIGKSCKTGEFRKQLPKQYLNVGIAEQNAAGVAAGLATCGKIPFVVTYAVFGSLRMCEICLLYTSCQKSGEVQSHRVCPLRGDCICGSQPYLPP